LQSEAKKANVSQGFDEREGAVSLQTGEDLGIGCFLSPRVPTPDEPPANSGVAALPAEVETPRTMVQVDREKGEEDQFLSAQEPMSNPLALLAHASDAAQASETSPVSSSTLNSPPSRERASRNPGDSEGHRLLHRPGYVSLGLQLDRASVVQGLDTLLADLHSGHQSLDYFKRTAARQCDVGPDLDPIELGLVTMEDAEYLFPM
jgi:hypothetical protein